jgi:hypothetical protein
MSTLEIGEEQTGLAILWTLLLKRPRTGQGMSTSEHVFGGDWTREKLHRVSKYIQAYATNFYWQRKGRYPSVECVWRTQRLAKAAISPD